MLLRAKIHRPYKPEAQAKDSTPTFACASGL
jgi:hypothetical protein